MAIYTHPEAGSVDIKTVKSGSVGILDQPIHIHGTIATKIVNSQGSLDVIRNDANNITGIPVAEAIVNTYSEEFNTNIAGSVILRPKPGNRLFIHSVYIATEANSGSVMLDFLSSGKKVMRFYASKYNYSDVSKMQIYGSIDEPLTLTTTTGTDHVFILVSYIETSLNW